MALSRRSDTDHLEMDTRRAPTPDSERPGPRRPTDAEAYQRVPRPVAAMPKTFADGSSTGWHHHARAQLLYATRGVMTVDTRNDRWTVPPMRALWIPACETHRVRMRGRVEMRTLYLDPPEPHALPTRCVSLEVTPLARALIERATEVPMLYDLDGADGLAMRLLVAEIERLPAAGLSLPLPADEALAELCARLSAAPAGHAAIPALAEAAGVSARTLTRRFAAQTGLTPVQWFQRMRALEAMARLAEGVPVTRVALDLGYDSPSAFSAMFRRTLGMRPSAVAGR
ncbi:MAG: helix-turn-helix transcriptional regulator [Burkholderiales bacterium]|jgi:AraC-like DNA-binding protein/quercetin dioxygenase-like cupin family protein